MAVRPVVPLFTASRPGLVSRRQLMLAGWSRARCERSIRDGVLVRVRRGVYASMPLPARGRYLLSSGRPDPGYVAEVRAVLMSLGPTAAAGGRTAAVLWGMDLLVEPEKIEVAVAAGRTHVDMRGVEVALRRNLEVSRLRVLGLAELRLTTPVDTVLDCALALPLREAVVVADSALRAGRVSVEQLLDGAVARRGHPGIRRIRKVLSLVDPESGSVLESVLRVLLLEHGYVPDTQVVVRGSNGRIIGRVDFAFVADRLVIECDGRRWHDPDDARESDRLRDNELERTGWRLLRFTWQDVLDRPGYVIGLVQDCLTLRAA